MARILIIDDEAPIRDIIRRILERAGHGVADAEDGRQGMVQLRKHPVDLVITDILMPGQEGIETILMLRKEFPQVKILAISGGGKTGRLDMLPSAQAFGAHRTLAKPFAQKDLLEAVSTLLS